VQHAGTIELLDAGRSVGAEWSRTADRPIKLLLLLLWLCTLLQLLQLLPGAERATGATACDGREYHQDTDHDARHGDRAKR